MGLKYGLIAEKHKVVFPPQDWKISSLGKPRIWCLRHTHNEIRIDYPYCANSILSPSIRTYQECFSCLKVAAKPPKICHTFYDRVMSFVSVDL